MRSSRQVILVVASATLTRDLLREWLEGAGYAVKTVADPIAALPHLESGEIDLVLLNSSHTASDSFTLCRRALAQKDGSYVPVILIAPPADDSGIPASLATGADDCLTGPLNAATLLPRVRLWLQARQGLAEAAAHRWLERLRPPKLEEPLCREPFSQPEARRSALSQAVVDAPHGLGPEGQSLDVDPAAADLRSCTRVELEALRPGALAVDDPAETQAWSSEFLQQAERWHEAQLRRAYGSLVPVAELLTPLEPPAEPVYDAVTQAAAACRHAQGTQQAALAALGQQALGALDLTAFLDDAVRLVRDTLDVDYCEAVALLPDSKVLLLRAGAGWLHRLVGTSAIGAGTKPQEGSTLLAGGPAVVEDLEAETCFSGPLLLRHYGVSSGLSAIIPGRPRPFGILNAHTTRRRVFSEDDVHFLEAVASLIAIVVECTHTKEDRAQLTAIVEQFEDAVIRKELDGTITGWNQGAERLYGYSPGEILGRHIALLVPTERADELAWIMERVRQGEPIERHETVQRRKSGEPLQVSISVSPLRDATGAIIGAVAVARDMTARERAETAAREAQALRQAEELQSALLLSVSHDLRSPLASIKTAVTSLLSAQAEPSPQARDELLHTIDNETDRLTRIVSRLLDLSRLEAGAIQPAQAWHDVVELLAGVAARLDPERARVRLHLPADRPMAYCDYLMVEQAVTNLLENALKYSAAECQVDVSAEVRAGQLTIEIADRGPGIPAADAERIFDKFYRGPASCQGRPGIGLGLAIARGQIRALGGEVNFRPRPDGGSIFAIRLPAHGTDSGRSEP